MLELQAALKLYAVHFGVWTFVWLFVGAECESRKKNKKDKMSDKSFVFCVVSLTVLTSLATFGLHWGLKP
jgi:hypothetical protein